LTFRKTTLNNLANHALFGFFEAIQSGMTVARLLNGLCFLLASTQLLALAIFVVRFYGSEVLAYDVLAFLTAWLGVASACAGFQRIAGCRPTALRTSPPLLQEPLAPSARTAPPLAHPGLVSGGTQV
jgi:hypothetical protein